MKIKVIAVGRLKEKYWQEAVKEYSKRLSPFAGVEIQEVAEERSSDNPGKAEIEKVKEKEGERILKQIAPGSVVIPLAIAGQHFSSEGLADYVEKLALEGKSNLTFIIGGSYGLSDAVLERGDLLLSFSSLTFPHQLMRVILMEQLYRVFSIINGGKYHK